MLPLIIIGIGKLVYFISRIFNIGSGGTWPGEIALRVKPDILKEFSSKLNKGCILVAGTNGKTTTSLMIKKILESEGNKVIHNGSGANLLNGVVSSFIQYASWNGQIDADWGVFEIDENSLPIVLNNLIYSSSEARSSRLLASNNKKLIIVLLNLFRDQLDRYGEVDVIAEKWGKALTKLPKLFQKQMEHATDSIFCLSCGGRLTYDGIYYSHLGVWKCERCGAKRPKPDISKWESLLPGVYNKYNALAAVSTAKTLGIPEKIIKKSLMNFSPAFGRQEEFIINEKKVKIFLSKNPAGFNETLRTVISLGAKKLLFVLNDRIPDGRDVSWIWDVDFEEFLNNSMDIIVSGDRAYDMALRIKYANSSKFQIEEDLKKAIYLSIRKTPKSETLYILPTYSAMLEVRKILKGRKIL
ncbi:Mur ligase family protein [Candidatus Gottesmanbacteria bacterium]|nr:Mur ligase family protein [Candidatus Gottesmanbacteria bacterium]